MHFEQASVECDKMRSYDLLCEKKYQAVGEPGAERGNGAQRGRLFLVSREALRQAATTATSPSLSCLTTAAMIV